MTTFVCGYMRAKKSYGQHFLINDGLCRDIAAQVPKDTSYDVLLEVGPGMGALTQHLISNDHPFYMVEADWDMVGHLKDRFPDFDHDRIILNDFLKLDLQKTFEGAQVGIIGNFPYNISSQIIFKIIEAKEQVPFMIGMFQKELADRVLSPHGSKVYGGISVFTDACYDRESLFLVSPNSFRPAPKVTSRVIQLTRKSPFPEIANYKFFRSLVKSAFGQRRKMLRNSLKTIVLDRTLLEGDTFNLRPEQLSTEDFIALANHLTTKITNI